MSFVNDQGGEPAGLGALAGSEVIEVVEPNDPTPNDRGRRRDRDEGPPVAMRIAKRPLKRLFLGQTAIDFWGNRRWALGISTVLVVISVISLVGRGLNLGIDFEGGVAYDVPANSLSVDDARAVLNENGIDGTSAKIEQRSSSSGDIIKVQIEDQPAEVRVVVQEALALAAQVDPADVSVASVSSSWGEDITRKAVTALVVFLVLIAIVIAVRFEWRMAFAAIVAMLHDVVVSAGIYSVFGFEVTPPTVIAFLTILGYSLYDTIVVFDRVKENERRIVAAGLSSGDLVNVSTNQVLMRSLNTSISAVLPVISLLVIGSALLGQVTLREFSIALLIGMLTGAYSSIFLATPLLGWLKGSIAIASPRPGEPDHLVGEELRSVVMRGVGILTPLAGRRRVSRAERAVPRAIAPGDGPASEAEGTRSALRAPEATTEQLLGRPAQGARPRKKKRH